MSKAEFLNDLEKINTLQDFFDVCTKHYDTEGTKLGFIQKGQLKNNVNKLILVTGAKERKKKV